MTLFASQKLVELVEFLYKDLQFLIFLLGVLLCNADAIVLRAMLYFQCCWAYSNVFIPECLFILHSS